MKEGRNVCDMKKNALYSIIRQVRERERLREIEREW